MKIIAKEFSILRGRALQNTIAEPGDGVWAYASVEVPDSVDDIIRVEGISTKAYHQPPQRYIKLLADHRREAYEDGTPPVVGRVEEFRIVTTKTAVHGEAKALAFRFSWATDGDGNVLPLAQKYKSLYEGGYLDSFSVGMAAIDGVARQGGGIDYTDTELWEISCVTVPCNSEATVIRSIEEALGPVKADAPKRKSIAKSIEDAQVEVKYLRAEILELKEIAFGTYISDQVVKALHGALAEISKAVAGHTDRLDLIESAIVVASDPKEQGTHDRNVPAHEQIDLTAVKAAIDGLAKKFDGK